MTAVEAGDAFQLDVCLRLTAGIKELCWAAQNRTEKKYPEERGRGEENETDMRGWVLELLKRPALTQTRAWDPCSLCRLLFSPPAFSQMLLWDYNPEKCHLSLSRNGWILMSPRLKFKKLSNFIYLLIYGPLVR